MRRIIILLTVMIFLTSFVSSEIIINQPSKEVYNIGDVINVNTILKSNIDILAIVNLKLVCGANSKTFYMNQIPLNAQEPYEITNANVFLTNNLIGICKIVGEFNGEFSHTNDFKISNSINF